MKNRPFPSLAFLPWLRWPVEIRTNGRLGGAGSLLGQCSTLQPQIFNVKSCLDRFFTAFPGYD